MKTKIKLLLSMFVMIAAFSAISCSNSSKKSSETTHEHQHEKMQYTCSMHPEVIKDEAGDCPKCGMELIEKKTNEHEEHSHDHNN